jgi:hypothetical protein
MRCYRLLSAIFVVSFTIVAGSCDRPEERGGLMLVVTQDGSLDLDALRLRVESGERILLDSGDEGYRIPGEVTLPATLGIVSNGQPDATVGITVSGWHGGALVDLRELRVLQVPARRVAELRVVLSSACSRHVTMEDGPARSTCPEGRTCNPESGDCESALVDGTALDDYTAEPDGGSPSRDPEDAGPQGRDANGGACTDGETRCASSTERQVCSDGQWGESERCEHICTGDDCGGACAPGDRQCDGPTRLFCSETGEWEDSGDCEGSCQAGRCTGSCTSPRRLKYRQTLLVVCFPNFASSPEWRIVPSIR